MMRAGFASDQRYNMYWNARSDRACLLSLLVEKTAFMGAEFALLNRYTSDPVAR